MTAGIAKEDSNLTVLNAAGGAEILALHADRAGPLLEEAALIDDQHRLFIAQVFDNIILEIVAHGIGVPAGAAQKVLHRRRRNITGRFGQLPTILTLQRRQKTAK